LNINYINQEQLTNICQQANAKTCDCALREHEGWQSIAEHRWPVEHLKERGTLRVTNTEEPTFEEHHPEGTRFESVNAPVAVTFFPYNRCAIFSCQQCDQTVLKYTEAGGYYVEQRARRIHAGLIL
jgi:hypothetical protein